MNIKSIINTLLLAAGSLFLGFLPVPQAHGTPVIDYNFEDGSIAGWTSNPTPPSTYLSVVADPLRTNNKVMKMDDTSTASLLTVNTTPNFSPALTNGIYVLTMQVMASTNGGSGSDYTFDRRISLTQSGTTATYSRIRSGTGNTNLIISLYNGGTHVNATNIDFNTWYEFTQTIDITNKTWSFNITDVSAGTNVYTSAPNLAWFSGTVSNINGLTITRADASGMGGLLYQDNVKLDVIPEPTAAILLLSTGLAYLMFRRRK